MPRAMEGDKTDSARAVTAGWTAEISSAPPKPVSVRENQLQGSLSLKEGVFRMGQGQLYQGYQGSTDRVWSWGQQGYRSVTKFQHR